MRTGTTSAWYAVKTVYRTHARGRARNVDRHYDPAATIVEERVVLFRAKSLADAIRKGEREARAYAKGCGYRNPYGQQVVTTYLEECDAFQLFNAPGEGREVYSRNEIVPSTVRATEVTDRLLGPQESQPDRRRRRFDFGST